MRIAPFAYLRPATLEEACQAVTASPGTVSLLAGGTDLVARLKQQLLRPDLILDCSGLTLQSYIRSDGPSLRIGSGTTLHGIAASPLVKERAPALAEAAGKVASQQIRNMATLGGNLCLETRCWFYNQSLAWKRANPPCFKAGGRICHVIRREGQCHAAYQGDTAPALLALNARITVVSTAGERVIPLQELYSGRGEAPLTLGKGDIVGEVRIPDQPPRTGSAYLKFSHRKAVDFPLASVAARVTLDGRGGRVTGVGLALSGIGPAPLFLPQIEELLRERNIDKKALAEAAEAALSASRPVHNLHHGPPALRRRMVGILSQLAIEEAASRAGG